MTATVSKTNRANISAESFCTTTTGSPSSRRGHAKTVKTNGAVVRAAITKLHPKSAVLVVLIKQGTTGHENPAPGGSSSVPGTLNNPDNAWLRSALNPV